MSFQRYKKIIIRDIAKKDQRLYNKPIIAEVDTTNAVIDFEVEGKQGQSSDIAIIKIHGASRTSYSYIDKSLKKAGYVFPIEIISGYESNNDYGVVFKGTIKKVQYHFNKGNQYLEITANENKGRIEEVKKPMSWTSSTGTPLTRRTIILDLLKNYGYSTEDVVIPVGYADEVMEGYTAEKNLEEELSTLCKDSKLGYKFEAEAVSIYPMDYNYLDYQPLDFDTGLITSPREDSNKIFEFETFLNHRVDINYCFAIKMNSDRLASPADSGDPLWYFKVTKFKHNATGNNFYTKVKCQLTHPDKEKAKEIYKEYYKDDQRADIK